MTSASMGGRGGGRDDGGRDGSGGGGSRGGGGGGEGRGDGGGSRGGGGGGEGRGDGGGSRGGDGGGGSTGRGDDGGGGRAGSDHGGRAGRSGAGGGASGAGKTPQRIETLAVHAGERRPGPEGSVVFPIYQGTVFAVEPGTDYHDIKYIRLSSTPTQRYLHDKLAALEGAEAAVATSSGMAAITTTLLTFLEAGDHFLAADCLYGGTHDFITRDSARLGWSFSFVDPQRPDTWAAALRPNTKLFYTETIANPLMRVPRLREIVEFARKHALTTLIDNTFASPVNFRPLSIGIDISFHSATKYLNGHSDLVAGCVLGREEEISRVRRTLNHYGGSIDPHAAFLLARGIKTLAIRVKTQNANGLALARFLSAHPKVAAVNYPGLESHPDHGHASELLGGFSGMLSFRLKGGATAAERMIASLNIPAHAPSLGSVESLITLPVKTSHAGMSREDRERIGVTDDLVRLSCGIENAEDLIADFGQALDRT